MDTTTAAHAANAPHFPVAPRARKHRFDISLGRFQICLRRVFLRSFTVRSFGDPPCTVCAKPVLLFEPFSTFFFCWRPRLFYKRDPLLERPASFCRQFGNPLLNHANAGMHAVKGLRFCRHDDLLSSRVNLRRAFQQESIEFTGFAFRDIGDKGSSLSCGFAHARTVTPFPTRARLVACSTFISSIRPMKSFFAITPVAMASQTTSRLKGIGKCCSVVRTQPVRPTLHDSPRASPVHRSRIGANHSCDEGRQ